MHIIEEINRYRLAVGMTQGSEKWVDLHYYNENENNTQTCIDKLKGEGYDIIATTPHENDCFVDDFDVSRKSAFFFGKENTGLSQQILDQADGYVKIPMFGFSESFNISVSVALLLQSLMRKLHNDDTIDWRLTEKEIIDLKIDWSIKTIQNGDRISAKYLAEQE